MSNGQSTHDVPERLISTEIRDVLKTLEGSQLVLNEAEFGYRFIKYHVQGVSEGGRILEIGSGPCVLLSQLVIDFPRLDIIGVEPTGAGFENFSIIQKRLNENFRFDLCELGYEKFQNSGSFDLIFLVNVFEHLPDWRHFLEFVEDKLEPSGKCVILCPNHSFPYESHFNLPIIFNKGFTFRLFKNHIKKYEVENNCEGLWNSLNFVKRNEVINQLSNSNLEIKFDDTISRKMVDRLRYDDQFAMRHKLGSFIATWVIRLGFLKLFEISVLRGFQPYMCIEITK